MVRPGSRLSTLLRTRGEPLRGARAAMRATRPAAGTAFAATQILDEPPEVIRPCLGFLRNRHIADPFVPGEWRQLVPERRDITVRSEECAQVLWHPMQWSRLAFRF